MSITKQKNGTYSVRIRWTDKQGKRREKTKTKFETKTLAKHWERQATLDAEAGKFDGVTTDLTVNELVDMYLQEYVRGKRLSTTSKVARSFEMYVLIPKWFDNVKVAKLSKVELQRWVNWLAGQFSSYKRKVDHFRKALDIAVSYELLESNPLNDVRYPTAVPKPDRSYRVEFYDRQQLQTFMQAVQDKYDNAINYHKYAYLRLLAFTGMRNGEVRALEWSDIHLEDNEPHIIVSKTTSETTGHGVVINPPKTKAGNRKVMLDEKTAGILRHWRATQGQQMMKRGISANGIVWTNQRLDNRISGNQPRSWLLSAIRDADVPQINIHGLRHTYITLAVQAGMDIKTLQSQVGHDDVKTTLAIYATVTDEMRSKTAHIFTQLVSF